MAKHVQVAHEGDLHGSPTEETMNFPLSWPTYEIDFDGKIVVKHRVALDSHVDSARKVGQAHRGSRRKSNNTQAVDPKALDAWAASNGVQLPTHGRLPADLMSAYHASVK